MYLRTRIDVYKTVAKKVLYFPFTMIGKGMARLSAARARAYDTLGIPLYAYPCAATATAARIPHFLFRLSPLGHTPQPSPSGTPAVESFTRFCTSTYISIPLRPGHFPSYFLSIRGDDVDDDLFSGFSRISLAPSLLYGLYRTSVHARRPGLRRQFMQATFYTAISLTVPTHARTGQLRGDIAVVAVVVGLVGVAVVYQGVSSARREREREMEERNHMPGHLTTTLIYIHIYTPCAAAVAVAS